MKRGAIGVGLPVGMVGGVAQAETWVAHQKFVHGVQGGNFKTLD